MNLIKQDRFLVCGGILVMMMTILSYRVIDLQWLSRKEQTERAKHTSHYKTIQYPANRGLIVDRNEEPLVMNIPLTNIYADKYHLEDENLISWGVAYKRLKDTPEWGQASDQERRRLLSNKRFSLLNNEFPATLVTEHYAYIVSLLAQPLQLDKAELSALLHHPKKKYIRLYKDLGLVESDRLQALLKENRVYGINFEKRLTRYYPMPWLATHLIGYTKGYQGETGVEARYNESLTGKDGFHKRKSTPNNLSIYTDEEELALPEQGLNVQLTIDTTLQAIVEEELDKGLAYAEAEQGCAVMVQPDTGEILAMVSRPHYNLNTREGVAKGSRNYILKTALEPGSTIKVLTMAAAMNERLVTANTVIDCEYGYYKDDHVTVKDSYPKDKLSVAQILAKSNNIGTYKVGRQLGRRRHGEYLEAFGLNTPTGLGWKGEVRTKGLPGRYPQDFASSTFGYAITTTPLHMALAYAAIANDGVKMRPSVVRAIISNEGEVIDENRPEQERRVLEADVARSLRRAMVSVTEEGSAKNARVLGYNVAGKTGTSYKTVEKIDPETGKKSWGYDVKNNVVYCSFGGMMPAEKPAFVCYIVVDAPKTKEVKRYGGTLAAPIFANIARRAAEYLNLEPTEQVENLSE